MQVFTVFFVCYQEYDATELVKNYQGPPPDILIDQVFIWLQKYVRILALHIIVT